MTIGELARFLGVQKSRIKRDVRVGRIPPAATKNERGWALWSPEQIKALHQQRLQFHDSKPVPINFMSWNQNRLRTFWWMVYERQNIWHRRWVQLKPPPWTHDPILRDNFFTNMYRELDPATKWLRRHILESDMGRVNKLFNIMLFRFIGSQESTYRQLGAIRISAYDPVELAAALKRIPGGFGRAYTVYANVADPSVSKIDNVAKLFANISTIHRGILNRVLLAGGPEEAYKVLRTVPAFGPFLAYQVLLDLMYTPTILDNGPWHPDDFVVAGPGALNGLKRLIPSFTKSQSVPAIQWLRDKQGEMFREYGFKFRKYQGQELHLGNIQNALCEFSKYARIQVTGRSTRRYRYEGQYD